MKVVLRNQGREVELRAAAGCGSCSPSWVSCPRRCSSSAAGPPHDRRGGGRGGRGRAPAGDLRGPRVKCRKCGAGPCWSSGATTPRSAGRLPGLLSDHVWRRSAVAHAHARGAGPDRGIRWKGFARALGRPPRRGLPDHGPLHRPRDLRVFGRLEGPVRGVRGRPRARLRVVAVADEVGAAIPAVREATRRPTCSACGLSKRYIMNRARWRAGSRWSPPATTSTTRPRPCSAPRCAGTSRRFPASRFSRPRTRGSAPGEAPLPDDRAPDGGLRIPARHRLHRG